MKLQPIETAPKDGTAVLCYRLFQGKPDVDTAYWKPDRKEFGGDGWSYSHLYQPTHWMPMPDPPEMDLKPAWICATCGTPYRKPGAGVEVQP
jgi:hypothetical protein